MTRVATIGVALAIALMPLSVAAQAPTLQASITLQGAGPLYRLTLSATVYSRAGFDDLRDLRVRDAGGQPMPYAWLDGDADAAAPRVTSARAPLFAVVDSSAGASSDAPLPGFKLRTDGSLALALVSGAKPAGSRPTDWLIDASKVTGAIVQARFELAPGALGVFAFTLEASDDLRSWRRVGGEEQLVRLQRTGRTIEQLALEVDHLHARILRVRWRDPSSAPALARVWLDSIAEAEPVAPLEWSGDVSPSQCTAETCDYAVPRGWSLQSLRITLNDADKVSPVYITSLPSSTAPAHRPRNALYVLRHGRDRERVKVVQELMLAETVVFRLTEPGGEARSSRVPLDGTTHTVLRLRSRSGIAELGSRPPSLSFGTRPRTLVFTAQGSPPFVLTGSAAGQPLAAGLPAPLALETLVPGYRGAKPLGASLALVTLPALPAPAASAPAPAASSPAPAASAPPPAASAPASAAPTPAASPSKRKRRIWAALGGGVVLLAAITWVLWRRRKIASARAN